MDHIRVASEIEAFLLESSLIKKNQPFFNIKLTDDKTYPMIQITKDENPAILISRKKNIKNADYFGPYTDAAALKQVLKLIRRIFPFQSVKNHPKRKCLYHHLGLCPCVLAVPENLEEYKKNIANIESFLKGKKNIILKNLLIEQKDFVKKEEFEKAQEIQEKIERINIITSPTYDPFHYIDKPDFYFERIEKEVISLKEILIKYYPTIINLERIECFDISNIQGKLATGSMVVFLNGEKQSSQYRKFKIRTKDTPDDFHMMQEMLTRRLGREEWPNPSLWVIDGGKGQVGAALKALASKNKFIPVIGLAKREETIVIPIKKIGGGMEFEEVKLSNSTPGVNLLRRIRDEAHRFAITYHILLRKKKLLQ